MNNSINHSVVYRNYTVIFTNHTVVCKDTIFIYR